MGATINSDKAIKRMRLRCELAGFRVDLFHSPTVTKRVPAHCEDAEIIQKHKAFHFLRVHARRRVIASDQMLLRQGNFRCLQLLSIAWTLLLAIVFLVGSLGPTAGNTVDSLSDLSLSGIYLPVVTVCVCVRLLQPNLRCRCHVSRCVYTHTHTHTRARTHTHDTHAHTHMSMCISHWVYLYIYKTVTQQVTDILFLMSQVLSDVYQRQPTVRLTCFHPVNWQFCQTVRG